MQSVVKAGGAPVLIPVITDMEALTAIVSGLDGLLMSGGGDINPLYVGEEPVPQLQDVDTFRDEFDLILLRLATNRQLPVMGICRGHQLINVAFSGSVYQDIHSQHEATLFKHSQTMPREQASHSIRITDTSSRLFDLLKKEPDIFVNSFHHQAVKDIAPEFKRNGSCPGWYQRGHGASRKRDLQRAMASRSNGSQRRRTYARTVQTSCGNGSPV